MKCIKCGNDIKEEWRCCYTCGALNVENEENKNMMVDPEEIGSVAINQIVKMQEEKRSANEAAFLIVNAIVYIIGFIACCFTSFAFLIVFPIFTISYFYFICMQRLMIKAKLPWWGLFIPIYNFYLICKLAFGNSNVFKLLVLISILYVGLTIYISHYPNSIDIMLVNIVLILYAIICGLISLSIPFCIGRSFNHSGIITLIFAPIIIPILAFSKKYTYGI